MDLRAAPLHLQDAGAAIYSYRSLTSTMFEK
jgi:hypothetical protein